MTKIKFNREKKGNIMNKDEKDIEERLLSNSSLDELIKIKMEQELKLEFDRSNLVPSINKVTDISKVPQHLIFSKKSVFRMFNRVNKSETFLNGIQAEAMIGLQSSVRDKIKAGLMDAFATDGAYVKFEGIEI